MGGSSQGLQERRILEGWRKEKLTAEREKKERTIQIINSNPP